MRRFLHSVAALGLLALAVPASAAVVTVTKVEGATTPDVVTLTGGIFTNQKVNMEPVVFTFANMSKAILYCIDLSHTISYGTPSPPLTYHTDTLEHYLSAYSLTTVQQIASLVQTGLAQPVGPGMNPVQGGIWQKLGATVTTGNATLLGQINAYGGSTATVSDLSRFVVYVSDNGKQTFVTAVPEPSAWALLIVGFGAIGVTARFRKQHAFRAVSA